MKRNCIALLVLIAIVVCGCTKPPPPPTPVPPVPPAPVPAPLPAPIPVPPPDTTPPPAITGLVASGAYNGEVILSWDQSTAGDFDHYNVYLSQAEITKTTGLTPVHQITEITTSRYRVTGLEDGTRYYFAVTAVDGRGNESPLPAMASAIPVAKETPPPPSDTTPPETVIISGPGETIDYSNVSFRWTGSDDSTATAELVYSYQLEGYDASYSPFTPNTGKTYTGLPPKSYVFSVKARDAAGNIDPTPATSRFTIATASTGGLLILRNSEVNRIAVGSDGRSIFALDSVNRRLYQSTQGGYGWVDISAGITAAGTWDELAVAPDAPEIVAVVTNSRTEVCLSLNGGGTFSP